MTQNNFSDGYKKVLINAENRMKKIGFKDLKQEDIFIEILIEPIGAIKEILDLYGINDKIILDILDKGIFNKKPLDRKGVYSGMDKELKDIILSSIKVAAEYKKEKASTEDFLISLLRTGKWLPQVLDYVGINPKDLETNLTDLQKLGVIDGEKNGKMSEGTEEVAGLFGAIADTIFHSLKENSESTPFDVNEKQEKKEDESTTPALDFFSTDLTKEAREGRIDKVIGRENEIERLISILNRKTKNNPVLIGEPGVGKTAIVEGLALKIASGDVPFPMKDKKILALDLNSMVAGAKYRGDFEARIKLVIDEASKVENDVILFIDEIHTMIGAGSGEGTLDASNVLKPAMGRGKIKVIGATTLKEYQKYIEKDSALERRFQKVTAPEPNKQLANEIILGIKEIFEEYHNLNITDEVVLESVELSSRYITDRQLPDKAIDLIDEACSLKSMKYSFDEKDIKELKEKISKINIDIEKAVISQEYQKAKTLKEKKTELDSQVTELKQKFSIPKDQRMFIKKEDIQNILSISTGIPVDNLSKTEIEKLKKLPLTIRSKIIGQDEAIDSIVKSIMRSKAGIGADSRPLGSFLFLGPTGVGKTELVKILASEFYSDEQALIKIDMSEYSDKTSVNKLIGSSAGYVGYEEGGLLTEKVRKKPYSIVLFDEIEKGDFEVYNLLLQILDEGVLTDNKGRKVNFKNTIIVMTSNIGQEEFSKKARQIGFDVSESEEEAIMQDYEKAKQNIKDSLNDYFSREFINRIDKVVIFNPLDKNIIKKIVKIRLEDFTKRLEKKEIKFSYDSKVLNFITKAVYNPEFGAREVRRYITDNIEDVVAEAMIGEKIKDKVEISILKNKIEFKY